MCFAPAQDAAALTSSEEHESGNSGRRALLFVGLAWIPAVVLAALQGFALNDHRERPSERIGARGEQVAQCKRQLSSWNSHPSEPGDEVVGPSR